MNRRGFLSGLLALAFAPVAAKFAEALPGTYIGTADGFVNIGWYGATRAAILNEHWLARIESVGAYENIRFIDTVQK